MGADSSAFFPGRLRLCGDCRAAHCRVHVYLPKEFCHSLWQYRAAWREVLRLPLIDKAVTRATATTLILGKDTAFDQNLDVPECCILGTLG